MSCARIQRDRGGNARSRDDPLAPPRRDGASCSLNPPCTNAAEVIERIVNVFEGTAQQILVQLSATLKMVVAQKLLPNSEELIAVREILVTTPAVKMRLTK